MPQHSITPTSEFGIGIAEGVSEEEVASWQAASEMAPFRLEEKAQCLGKAHEEIIVYIGWRAGVHSSMQQCPVMAF